MGNEVLRHNKKPTKSAAVPIAKSAPHKGSEEVLALREALRKAQLRIELYLHLFVESK